MKNILIYLFVLLLFTCSTCERIDSNPSTETISLENRSGFNLELRFFEQGEVIEVELENGKTILLHGGVGMDDLGGVLREYPTVYDSLEVIKNNTIQKVYYDQENDSNACLVEKNPLCLEQYEKTVKKGRKGATTTKYLIVIE